MITEDAEFQSEKFSLDITDLGTRAQAAQDACQAAQEHAAQRRAELERQRAAIDAELAWLADRLHQLSEAEMAAKTELFGALNAQRQAERDRDGLGWLRQSGPLILSRFESAPAQKGMQEVAPGVYASADNPGFAIAGAAKWDGKSVPQPALAYSQQSAAMELHDMHAALGGGADSSGGLPVNPVAPMNAPSTA